MKWYENDSFECVISKKIHKKLQVDHVFCFRFVRDQGFCFHLSQQEQLEKVSHNKVISEEASITFFYDVLLGLTESSLQEATRDVLLASRCQPFHGKDFLAPLQIKYK